MPEDQDAAAGGRDQRLGEFLRSRRGRIAASSGSIGGRRRTAGLRREEVASLAGISTEWYIKLEQGRATSPSVATLDGIARALRLDETERTHLFALAGRDESAKPCALDVPATLRTIVEGLTQPAYLTNRCWDVVAWNRAAVELLQIDFDSLAIADRNILVWMLTDVGARMLFDESWDHEARRMVSLFRTTCDLHGSDPAIIKQISRLQAESRSFGEWWEQHDIRAPRSGAKRLHHPTRGDVTVLFSTFQANDDPNLKLALYLTADAAGEEPPSSGQAA